MPDAGDFLQIAPAEIKADGRSLVPLFGRLEAAAGVEPFDIQTVAPVLATQNRLCLAKPDDVRVNSRSSSQLSGRFSQWTQEMSLSWQ